MHKLKEATVVFRKSWAKDRNGTHPVVVVMQLPKGTLVNRPITSTQKNRASRALVLAIRDGQGKDYAKALPKMEEHRDGTEYVVGEFVEPARPFDRSDSECASGIHFFRRYGDAAAY